ncbi:MAG: PilN domain-containing protein [Burkholderiales bacterium]
MILINLLPHREERRKRRKVAFFVGLGVAAVAGLVIVGAWYLLVLQMTAAQQERNQFLKTEITKLEVQIKDIAMLKAEIEALKARQKAVENLQTDRNIPVHVLNDLVRQTPEGVYFTSVKQNDQMLVLSGIAQTNERVSELLRNLAYNAEWLTKPDLVEIRAANVQTATREQKRLFDFSVRVTIKRPPDAKAEEAEAATKSGAAKAAKKS